MAGWQVLSRPPAAEGGGRQASLYRTCHPAILGHRGRRLATAQPGVSKPGRSTVVGIVGAGVRKPAQIRTPAVQKCLGHDSKSRRIRRSRPACWRPGSPRDPNRTRLSRCESREQRCYHWASEIRPPQGAIVQHFTASDGLQLAYAIEDFTDFWTSASTLLLLHAAMSHSGRYYAWVPRLSRHYRVVRMDLRGHTASTVRAREHFSRRGTSST
jgi:hypothetical protein